MINRRFALIVGTEVGVSDLESGASLRIDAVKQLFQNQGYDVTIVGRNNAKASLNQKWDAIALVSFSTARYLRLARGHTSRLWFDPTDSWSLTRWSLIRRGHLSQFLALLRDVFFVWTAPRIDLITFISSRDKASERLWWLFRNKPFVFPVSDLAREIHLSASKRLVFVGDGRYPPNQHALIFLEEILSRLPSNVSIHVFGMGFDVRNPRFVFHGYTPANRIYLENDIHLAPIFSGAGIKLKVAVPAWNGLRVITTPEGANGLGTSINITIGESVVDFVQQIELALREPLRASYQIVGNSLFLVDERQVIKSYL